MEDLNPVDPRRKQLIESYGEGGFTVSNVVHRGGVTVLPGETRPWPVTDVAALTLDDLSPILDATPAVEILLVGSGPKMVFLPPEVRKALRAKGIGVEVMDTGAACRTYNVLIAEDRRVAAVLVAV